MRRTVAIVGRPNVGKSTLFNRLTGKWTAIVDDQSGVTRDRIQDTVEWEGRHFTLLDTGGYLPQNTNALDEAIRHQVEVAIDEASLVLFMVDVRTGVTKEDEQFAKQLRRQSKPVIVVANKADNLHYEFDSYVFYQLGFEEVFPISSTSGTGSGELLDKIYNHLNLDQVPVEEAEPEESIPRFALLGRPNTGKSTMVNALLDEDRSIVSDQPGTTRDALNMRFNKFNMDFELVDTAGLRKEKRINPKDLEHIANHRAIRAIEMADVCFVMLDAVHGLEKQDINIVKLILNRRKGVVILVNKWDHVEKDDKTHLDYIEHLENRMNLPMKLPIHFVSALKKHRLIKALKEGEEVYHNLHQRLPTAQLNNVMLKAIQDNPPPSDQGRWVHIKYVTQLDDDQLTIGFFCNTPEAITSAYKKFLERTLRKHFNLKGVPVELIFKRK
jgi:GTP-binding protein